MINAQRVRSRSYVVNDRTKLNTINQLAKRAKSALCKQIERKAQKKHQNIWFIYGKLRTFVSNQSGKNNLKKLSVMYSLIIARRLRVARIAKRIVESALALAIAKLAVEIVLIINS